MQVIHNCETVKYCMDGIDEIPDKYGYRSECNDNCYCPFDTNGMISEDCVITYKNRLRHSFNDQPAYKSDTQSKWYKDGMLHRDDDKPAVITEGKEKVWIQYDKIKRDGDKYQVVYYDEGEDRTNVVWYTDQKEGVEVKRMVCIGNWMEMFD